MYPTAVPDVRLAARLRALREQTWPRHVVTQAQLAQAFSAERSTSVPLISSWENTAAPKTPPDFRLEEYARFFATARSVEGAVARLLPLGQLDDEERVRYDELRAELTELRATVLGPTGPAFRQPTPAESSLWHFTEDQDILIVCARLPEKYASRMGSFTDPNDAEYVDLYTYADPDALIELFGHLRMTNPHSQVNFTTSDTLVEDDYTKHLVLLGGVDWNTLTQDVLRHVKPPVRQMTRVDTDEPGGFEVVDGPGGQAFRPVFSGGVLVEDVAHFYRRSNPFNKKRTVTFCNGMFGRGTYGAVRALTDKRFRDRNDQYVRDNVDVDGSFSLLMKVQIVNGKTLTPDWTRPETRLHQWPEAAH